MATKILIFPLVELLLSLYPFPGGFSKVVAPDFPNIEPRVPVASVDIGTEVESLSCLFSEVEEVVVVPGVCFPEFHFNNLVVGTVVMGFGFGFSVVGVFVKPVVARVLVVFSSEGLVCEVSVVIVGVAIGSFHLVVTGIVIL